MKITIPLQASESILLVCGGRDYEESEVVFAVLDFILAQYHKLCLPPPIILTGGARGADRLTGKWADSRGLDRIDVPGNWIGRGKAAGFYRNGLMLRLLEPDWGLSFPGGPGTANMIEQLRRAGTPHVYSSEIEFGRTF